MRPEVPALMQHILTGTPGRRRKELKMAVKEAQRIDRVLDRVSVTQRPGTGELLEQMLHATRMSKSDIYNVGIDVLHFVWTVLRGGGQIGVKLAGETEYKPVNIFIPGMTTASISVDK